MIDALVIGSGPAGLMAADQLATAGHSVVVADAMPSVGRKFLMAGKSGLNLTKDESVADFMRAYTPPDVLKPVLADFGPEQVKAWAASLDQETFTGSSGRVFPTAMKASPLLRAWLVRLRDMGVEFRMRHRWKGGHDFETPDGPQTIKAKVVILALGGGSWSRLGSNGAWVETLRDMGADIVPFRAANVGFDVEWSRHMEPYFGHPVKPVRLSAGEKSVKGEFVLTKNGLEGSAIYAVSSEVVQGFSLSMDLVPDLSPEALSHKLNRPRGKASQSNFLRKALGLSPAKLALINELARPFPKKVSQIPFKSLNIPVAGHRPIDEAISTAGGLSWNSLDSDLRLKDAATPTFCVGEMLDWDAPTGGYLITGCLATGRWAGLAAVRTLALGEH